MSNSYHLPLSSIVTSSYGVQSLWSFYDHAKNFNSKTIELNISKKNKVDANLSALLLAISHKLKNENDVHIRLIYNENQHIFERNGLVSHMNGEGNKNEFFDNRASTIPLTTFDKIEGEKFCSYLRNDFFEHRSLSHINESTKEELIDQFIEIFSNVEIHADTENPVFACGQYFPKKRILKFSLVDLGCGFLPRINKFTNGEIVDDILAIKWATKMGNSTKDIASLGPGGIGLKQLKSYCYENNGSLHINSGRGYVKFTKGQTLEKELEYQTYGSMVSIIMRSV